MRTRRAGLALFFLILATVLLGSGASARPTQSRADPALAMLTQLTTTTGHTGRHCRTRRDPVAPDPADV